MEPGPGAFIGVTYKDSEAVMLDRASSAFYCTYDALKGIELVPPKLDKGGGELLFLFAENFPQVVTGPVYARLSTSEHEVVVRGSLETVFREDKERHETGAVFESPSWTKWSGAGVDVAVSLNGLDWMPSGLTVDFVDSASLFGEAASNLVVVEADDQNKQTPTVPGAGVVPSSPTAPSTLPTLLVAVLTEPEPSTLLSYTSFAKHTTEDALKAGAHQRVDSAKLGAERLRDPKGNLFALHRPADMANLRPTESVLLDLTVAVAGAAMLALVSSRVLKLPAAVGLLLAGALLGPSCADLIGGTVLITTLGEVGGWLVLFMLGLEFAPSRVLPVASAALHGSVTVMLVLVAVCAALSWTAGAQLTEAVMVGSLLSMSSTAFTVKDLALKKETATPEGRATVGVLILQDVLLGVLLTAMPALGLLNGGGGDWVSMALQAVVVPMVQLAALVGVLLLLCRRFMPWVLLGMTSLSVELQALIGTGVCFLMVRIFLWLGLSAELGAFYAGVLLTAGAGCSHEQPTESIPRASTGPSASASSSLAEEVVLVSFSGDIGLLKEDIFSKGRSHSQQSIKHETRANWPLDDSHHRHSMPQNTAVVTGAVTASTREADSADQVSDENAPLNGRSHPPRPSEPLFRDTIAEQPGLLPPPLAIAGATTATAPALSSPRAHRHRSPSHGSPAHLPMPAWESTLQSLVSVFSIFFFVSAGMAVDFIFLWHNLGGVVLTTAALLFIKFSAFVLVLLNSSARRSFDKLARLQQQQQQHLHPTHHPLHRPPPPRQPPSSSPPASICSPSAFLASGSARACLSMAGRLSHLSEFSFLLLARGLSEGLINRSVYQLLSSVAALSLLLVPLVHAINPLLLRLCFGENDTSVSPLFTSTETKAVYTRLPTSNDVYTRATSAPFADASQESVTANIFSERMRVSPRVSAQSNSSSDPPQAGILGRRVS